MPKPSIQTVAAEIRAELARQQKTQGDLAGALNVSQAAISRRLAGKATLRTEDVEAIAAYLGVSVRKFMKVAA